MKSDLNQLNKGETSDLVQQTVSNWWSYIGGMETGNTWNQKLIVYFPVEEKGDRKFISKHANLNNTVVRSVRK